MTLTPKLHCRIGMGKFFVLPRRKLVLFTLAITLNTLLETRTVSSKDTNTLPDQDDALTHENLVTNEGHIVKEEKPIHSSWISHILSEKLSRFRPHSHTNPQCNEQTDLYETSLQNLTLWALQMQEASAASTAGMLVGQQFQMGHYDECLAIQTSSVAGRYCLVDINFAPTSQAYPNFYANKLEDDFSPPESSAWEILKKSKNPYRRERNNILWAVCVPAACSRQDVEESLNAVFAKVQEEHGIIVNMFMADTLCSSSLDDDSKPLSMKITVFLFVFLTALAVFATFCHIFSNDTSSKEKDTFGRRLILTFSIVKNIQDLMRVTEGKDIVLLDALKFYSTVLLIIGHRVSFYAWAMIYNQAYYEKNVLEKNNYMLLVSPIVDIFFTISGFLVFFVWYSRLKKQGLSIFISAFVQRWLRLMPPFLSLVLCNVTLLPYLGDGPLWKATTFPEAERCQRYWWTHVIGLNNIIGAASEQKFPCAIPTWYLACDLQLFPVAILIVYALSRSQSGGLKVALGVLAASIAVPFLIIYINHYDGVVKLDQNFIVSNQRGFFPNEYFTSIYMKSYTRAGPYILSIIAAVLLFNIQEKKWTLSVPMRWFILIIAIVVGGGSHLYGSVLCDPDRAYDALENALYGALHRPLWSLMFCAIIVIQVAWGFGKYLDVLLTHPIYVPLSRLTYLVYLFHVSWQLQTIGSLRGPVYISGMQLVWMSLGDAVLIFIVALWLYCIVEGPSNNLRTVLRDRTINTGKPVTEREPQASEKAN